MLSQAPKNKQKLYLPFKVRKGEKRGGKGSALRLEGEETELEWMGKVKGMDQFSKIINNY